MSSDNRVVQKRSLAVSTALLAICGIILLPGCNDRLLPAEPATSSQEPAKIVFSEITQTSATEYYDVFVRIDADGGSRADLTAGTIVAPPGAAGAAIVRQEDNTIWLSPISGSGAVAPQLIVTGRKNPNDPQSIDGLSVVATPDGTRITYTTYVDRTTTIGGAGTAVTLPRGVAHEATPSFSPDGLRLAFFSTDSNWFGSPGGLYIVNVDGSDLRRLASCERIAYSGQSSIDWSPSGDRLVYVNEGTEIRVVNVDGSGGQTVASGVHPVWNPTGDSILYTHASAAADLYLGAANGSGTARQITATPAVVEFHPRFSPDGKQILYTSYAGRIDDAPGHLIVQDLATGTSRILSEKAFRGFWVK